MIVWVLLISFVLYTLQTDNQLKDLNTGYDVVGKGDSWYSEERSRESCQTCTIKEKVSPDGMDNKIWKDVLKCPQGQDYERVISLHNRGMWDAGEVQYGTMMFPELQESLTRVCLQRARPHDFLNKRRTWSWGYEIPRDHTREVIHAKN